MTTYELLVCTAITDTDADRQGIIDRVGRTITDAGGAIMGTRPFGRQRLSYPITHATAGDYTIVDFRAPSDAPSVITRELRLQREILRFLCSVKNEKARVMGQEVEAMERAQERRAEAKAAASSRVTAEPIAPRAIENLDEKLEEILGKEMV